MPTLSPLSPAGLQRRRGGVLNPAASPAARYTPAGPFWQDEGGATPATADGALVARWDDVSGNGRHLTNPVANTGKQPVRKLAQINGLATVRSDGVDDYLKTAAIPTLVRPWTVYLVIKPLRTANSQFFCDGFGDLSGGLTDFSLGPWNLSLEYNGFVSQRSPANLNGQCYWPGSRWTPNSLAPMPIILSACFNNAASWVRVNDAVKYGGVTPGAADAAGFTLACRGNNVNNPAQADYAEVILYNRALTADEDAGTLAYLNGKYNLYDPGVPANAPLVVCHGNSLTWGSSASIAGPYPGATSWPSVLWRTYGSPIRVINLGTPGQTSTYLNGQYSWQVEPYYDAGASKRIAIFWEGVNEYAHVNANLTTGPPAAYAKLNSWVTAAKAKGWYTIVATALPSTAGVLTPDWWIGGGDTTKFQPQYNALVLANSAGAHAVVDLAALLPDPTNTLYYDPADHLHLRDPGYSVVAGGFKPVIQAAP